MELASMDNYFDSIAKKFAEETNRKIVEFLGSGAHGNAYLTNDNKVIKITTDKSEYDESRKLLNKNTVHLAKVYDCYVVESKKLKRELPNLRGMWVILLEYVESNRNEHEFLFNQLLDAFEEDLGLNLMDELSSYQVGINSTDDMIDYLNHLNISEDAADYYGQIISMIIEMEEYGITSIDYGPNNFGFRGNTLVFFDLGFGEENDAGEHKKFTY